VNISTDGTDLLLLVDCRVEVDVVTFVQDGEVVATLHGYFDFKELPDHLHVTALNILMRNRAVMHLKPIVNAFPVEEPKTRPWWKFW
jgi:hypothetical protein